MPNNFAIDHDRRIATIVGAILLVTTYFAFSLRALTDPIEPGQLLSAKRFVVVTMGTAMFWLVARHVRRSWTWPVPTRLAGVAALFVTGLVLVLVSRIAYDLWITGETQDVVVRSLRWTVVWSGYFGTAVLGYFAAILAQSLRVAAVVSRGTREQRMATVLNEVSTWPASDRRLLAVLLDQPVRYEEADPLFAPIQNP